MSSDECQVETEEQALRGELYAATKLIKVAQDAYARALARAKTAERELAALRERRCRTCTHGTLIRWTLDGNAELVRCHCDGVERDPEWFCAAWKAPDAH